MRIVIREPRTKQDFDRYYQTKWYILRRPWHQPKGSEKDKLDGEAVHLMAVDGKRVVGVARLHFNEPGVAQFRGMGVDRMYRHRGIGTRLLRALERKAKDGGARVAWFNAREPAVPFYEKCGYAVFDTSYNLFGCIPHWKMMKEL